jgi:hypothetical protein
MYVCKRTFGTVQDVLQSSGVSSEDRCVELSLAYRGNWEV